MGQIKPWTLRRLRGRNGFDDPLDVPDDQCVEALNVEWYGTPFARKRNGAEAIAMTLGANGAGAMFRHVPGVDESLAELWVMQRGSGTFKRLASGVESLPTMKDIATLSRATGASFNGKLSLQYKSPVDRGHVWDGATVRRQGLAMPLTAVFASEDATVAGAITDTRKYKFRLLEKSGSTIVRRSEANTATLPTVLSAKRYTATPTIADEGETHWELWAASITNNYATYHYVGEDTIVNPITDNEATLTTDVEPLTGTYSLIPSCKYAVADDVRIVFAGPYETEVDGVNFGELQPKVTRVWFTPALGDRDVSDDERIVYTVEQRNYFDITEAVTGLAIHNGIVFVFSERGIWRAVPTGDLVKPYIVRRFSRTVGCVSHLSIVHGEDESGNDALYFMSGHGPYRIVNALAYCGHDVYDIVRLYPFALNVTHAQYHADKRQVWMWIEPAIDGWNGLTPYRLRFHVADGRMTIDKGVTGGWALDIGDSVSAYCSAMYSDVFSVGGAQPDLKPHIGSITAPTEVWKCDAVGVKDDEGEPFQAYVETKPLQPAGPQMFFKMRVPTLIAEAAVNVWVSLTLIKDFGLEPRFGTVSLTPAGQESHINRQFEDAVCDRAKYLAFRVGDLKPVVNAWTLSELQATIESDGAWS